MPTVYRFGPFRLDATVASLTRDETSTGLGARAVRVLLEVHDGVRWNPDGLIQLRALAVVATPRPLQAAHYVITGHESVGKTADENLTAPRRRQAAEMSHAISQAYA